MRAIASLIVAFVAGCCGAGAAVEPAPPVAETQMATIAVFWPRKVNPGDTVKVTCKVRPEGRIASDSPVGLRLLSHGETVCEQWIEPDSPLSTWEPGKTQAVTFPAFYVPVYTPQGRLQAEVVSRSTRCPRPQAIWVGPPAPPCKPEQPISVSALRVVASRGSDGVTELRVSAQSRHAGKSTRYAFTLTRGETMWFACDLALLDGVRVQLPKGFPSGNYTARLVPHGTRSRSFAECRVDIPGAEATSGRPLGHGVYVDRCGVRHNWHISQPGTLIWDGKPYIPIGVVYRPSFIANYTTDDVSGNERAFREDVERLKAMKAAGVTDLCLGHGSGPETAPAWVWQRIADVCEELALSYGIELVKQNEPGSLSLGPGMRFWIEPVADGGSPGEPSAADLYGQAADKAKKHHDVPVVLSGVGADAAGNSRAHGGFGGVGVITRGSASRTMWNLAIEAEPPSAGARAGCPDPAQLTQEFGSLAEAGAKGIFCAAPTDPGRLNWLGAFSRLAKSSPRLADYEPGTGHTAGFLDETLGVRAIDLGQAFQAIRSGSTTYIWNLTSEEQTLVLERDGGDVTLHLAPRAEKPVVIENDPDPKVTGIDKANLIAAMQEWSEAQEHAKALGVATSVMPPSDDWREIYKLAAELRRKIADAERTKTAPQEGK